MTIPFLKVSSLEMLKGPEHTTAAEQRKSKMAPSSEIVHTQPHGARGEEEAPKTNSLSLSLSFGNRVYIALAVLEFSI